MAGPTEDTADATVRDGKTEEAGGKPQSPYGILKSATQTSDGGEAFLSDCGSKALLGSKGPRLEIISEVLSKASTDA